MHFPKLFVPYVKNPRKTRVKANLAKYDLTAVLLCFHLHLSFLILVAKKSRNNQIDRYNNNLTLIYIYNKCQLTIRFVSQAYIKIPLFCLPEHQFSGQPRI